MKNTREETISTGKKIIYVITIIIAIACSFGMIYGIARGNSMIIGQTSALAALDTSIICLNNRNIKKDNEAKKNEVVA